MREKVMMFFCVLMLMSCKNTSEDVDLGNNIEENDSEVAEFDVNEQDQGFVDQGVIQDQGFADQGVVNDSEVTEFDVNEQDQSFVDQGVIQDQGFADQGVVDECLGIEDWYDSSRHGCIEVVSNAISIVINFKAFGGLFSLTKVCDVPCRLVLFPSNYEGYTYSIGYQRQSIDFEVQKGRMTRINVELDSLLRYDFDGEIVFRNNEKLVVIERDNGLNELANDAYSGYSWDDILVSPDGNFISYYACTEFSEENEDVCIGERGWKLIRSNGELVEDIGIISARLTWSHDSTSLAWFFEGNIYIGEDICLNVYNFLDEVEPERILCYDSQDYSHNPVFSPDDSKIAYIFHTFGTHYDILLVDRDGVNLVDLTPDFGISGWDSDLMDLQWFPDGQKLIYRVTGVPEEENQNGFYVVETDGTGFRRVVEENGNGVQIRGDVELSHDGRYYVYARQGVYDRKLILVDTTTWESRELIDLASFLPGNMELMDISWSPQDDAVAVRVRVGFIADVYEQIGYIFIVDLAGIVYRILDLGQSISYYGSMAWSN